jgi:hypothetical protein
MQDEEKLRIVHLMMHLEVCIHACDNTENIKWFNRQKTKMIMKNFVDIVLKEHGHLFKAFWETPGLDMTDFVRTITEFGEVASTVPLMDLPELTAMIKNFKETKYGKQ